MPTVNHITSCEMPNDPSTGGGRATPGIDHGRFAPGSGRPRERDAPSSPGVGHTPGIATTPGSPGWGMTPGTSGHFLLQIGKTEQKQSKNKNKIRLFATCLAFCTVFAYKKTKSVQKSSQVAKKQKKSIFFRPTPGQRHRCDGPTPGHTSGYRPRPRCPRVGPPRAAPREMWPDPGVPRRCPGSARPLPALGSLGIPHGAACFYETPRAKLLSGL